VARAGVKASALAFFLPGGGVRFKVADIIAGRVYI
jgi:hypothetical protein